MARKFYEDGLKFDCRRCSACCRHDPGFVFLSRDDAEALATSQGMGYSDFVAAYCRWIPQGGGVEALSLREKSNYDCVFWAGEGCSVYGSRPLQCRTFPFWDSVVATAEAWEATAEGCPGMGEGRTRTPEEIEEALARRAEHPIVTRGGR